MNRGKLIVRSNLGTALRGGFNIDDKVLFVDPPFAVLGYGCQIVSANVAYLKKSIYLTAPAVHLHIRAQKASKPVPEIVDDRIPIGISC